MAFFARWQETTPLVALAVGEGCYLCQREADFWIAWKPGRFIVVCAGHVQTGRLYVACQLAQASGADLDVVLARFPVVGAA